MVVVVVHWSSLCFGRLIGRIEFFSSCSDVVPSFTYRSYLIRVTRVCDFVVFRSIYISQGAGFVSESLGVNFVQIYTAEKKLLVAAASIL